MNEQRARFVCAARHVKHALLSTEQHTPRLFVWPREEKIWLSVAKKNSYHLKKSTFGSIMPFEGTIYSVSVGRADLHLYTTSPAKNTFHEMPRLPCI